MDKLTILTPTIMFLMAILGKIGDETCERASDCSAAVAHSYCDNGTCECITGFYATPSNTTCLKSNFIFS